MGLHPLFWGPGACTGLQKGRKGVVIRGDASLEHVDEEGEGLDWGVGAGVAAGHGVEEDDVWVGNSIEQAVGIVHGRGLGMEGAGGDELVEHRRVVLEIGFDGEGVELLEFSQGGAFGEEGDERWEESCFGSWVIVVAGFGFGGREGIDRQSCAHRNWFLENSKKKTLLSQMKLTRKIYIFIATVGLIHELTLCETDGLYFFIYLFFHITPKLC